jgi:two-component system nitrate/nitrite response regulator NarL
MKTIIRVTLVEDHPSYRETVGLALEGEADMKLVGEFGTAERALRQLGIERGRIQADVILLDLNLPGMSGLEAIPLCKAAVPDAKVIVLTQSDREADVLRAIASGASGYLLKSSTVKQITEGIRTVVAGGASLDANVAHFILDTLRATLPEKDAEDLLTPREMEVLNLLSEGLAKKEIADKLGISPTTVVTHVSHIYEKLQVQNAPGAVAKAFGAGILPVEERS